MINLLPPEEKTGLLAEETKRLTIILALVILFSTFCLIIVLSFLRIYLWIQVDAQKNTLEVAKNKAEDPEIKIMKEKIDQYNEKIARIDNFYEQKSDVGGILEKLIQATPEGIYFTEFAYSKNSSQIIMAGFSPSHSLLEKFKANLEKEGFKEIFFPDVSWIEPININFSGVKISVGK